MGKLAFLSPLLTDVTQATMGVCELMYVFSPVGHVQVAYDSSWVAV